MSAMPILELQSVTAESLQRSVAAARRRSEHFYRDIKRHRHLAHQRRQVRNDFTDPTVDHYWRA